MNAHRFPRTLVTLLLLAAAAASGSPAHAVDSWTRVGSGGLGDPARHKVTAMAVHGGYVWVATTDDTAGPRRPLLLRARLTADSAWSAVTPPWDVASGEITDLEPFGGYLFVATDFGEVWRHSGGGGWRDVTPALWAGHGAVHALGRWNLSPSTSTLCAARGSLRVQCGLETGTPMSLPAVPLSDSRPVGSADLKSFHDRLFLAVGGLTEGSRTCEVLSYQTRWSAVTTDCFGNADRTWLGKMAVFEEQLYVGTGGHTDNVLVRLTPAGTFEDVTPAFYGFGSAPRRFPGAAVAVGKLFIGAHVSLAFPAWADVIRTDDGTTWEHSNEPGFGGEFNEAASELATSGLLLYAGVFNGVDGLEVWRRNFLVAEMIDENHAAYRDLIVESRRQALCLRLRIRGCPSRLTIAARFAMLKEGVDTARHPADDAKLILVTRQRFAAADKDLAAALELAGQADKMALVDPAKAKVLYLQAAQRLETATKTTQAAWEAMVTAQRPGKG